ncbi:hypothetical protein [Algoriphagus sp.]|uniref:hypothetical protein n=1 Tax=Algoriphagus sp. TaxID=1872435 RepID=UPI0026083029|nr:hypothetical protein [Algoriphagus sp.]
MHFLATRLRWISYFSLDVVFGAMAGMLFFSKVAHVELAWPPYVLLALAVWCIYNLDHYLDSRKEEILLSSRRKFHRRSGNLILGLVFVFGILGLVGGFWWFGWGLELQLTIGLGLLIGGIRLLVWKFGKGWMKEFSIAVFYVAGISWLPFLSANPLDRSGEFFLFLGLYLLLALLNLLILSQLDAKEDQKAGFFSATKTISPQNLRQWIKNLGVALVVLQLALLIVLPSFFKIFGLILLLMTLVHVFVFLTNTLNPEQQRMRMEWAFSIPWVLLLF